MKSTKLIIQRLFDKAVEHRYKAVICGIARKHHDAEIHLAATDVLLEQLEWIDSTTDWKAKLFQAV